MKVSIITATYNSSSTVRSCIESVTGQSYKNIEHIIVDGASNDFTVDIINSIPSRIKKIISESDNGIYDAMNKGIMAASGDLVGFLNSDDSLASTEIVSQLVKKITHVGADTIYVNLNYINKNNKIIRRWRGKAYSRNDFKYGWMPPHPSFYVRRSIFDKCGTFNLRFGTAADYEFMVRTLYRFKASSTYLSKTVVNMCVGGVSNKSFKNRLDAHINDWKAWNENGISKFPYWVLLKPTRKITQYVRK